jgi:hypothetical protein
MSDHSLSGARLIFFTALLVPLSLLIAYLLTETAYRAYLYYLYVIEQNFPVTTMDVRPFPQLAATPGSVYGFYQPGKPITFTNFDGAGNISQRHTVQINNFGWPSQHGYSRSKQPGEFRIAIVGDSMTASINNERPWPDLLQRNLNADRKLLEVLKVQRITVLNLGVAGASMQLMANPLAVIARRFSADMVLVNFIGDDLRRRHGDAFSNTNAAPVVPAEPAVADDTPPMVTSPDLLIEGVGIDLLGCDHLREISNPGCRVSPYFFLPRGAQLDKEGINRIKAELASRVFWSRVAKSIKPLLLLEVLGQPAVQRPPAPNSLRKLLRRERPLMDDIVQRPEKEQEDLVIALGAIKFIKSLHKEVMLIHNPVYWYLIGHIREPALEALSAAVSREGLEVTRMEKYLPPDKSERDWVTWYNLPHDGHWSDFGAEIYAQAVYKALRERLLATTPGSAGAISSAPGTVHRTAH